MYKDIERLDYSNYKRGGRAICQFTLEGKFIKEYKTMTDASRDLQVALSSIYRAANRVNGTKSAGGFQWRYSDECEKLEN